MSYPSKFNKRAAYGGGRLAILDELRGFAIINMAAYHVCYDLVFIHGFDWPWFRGARADLWQEFICLSFIFIAGVCTRFSGRPFVRAFKVCVCALLITAVTLYAYPDQLIVFGILHCLGASMLIYAVLAPLFRGFPAPVGFVLAILLALATWNVVNGVFGIGSFSVRLPSFLYGTGFLFPFGLKNAGFFSADYFPLLPYLFVFLAGSAASPLARLIPPVLGRVHARPLAYLGRHSMLIYLLHQPIAITLLGLLL
ncbi:MAG: DUF1624 domain-containing protein [Clostridiales Family XIII bacterium]|jgi:uncharacterized membrane protein|nr:DUF1624 domain-containing protein [Clostridiales Family XIII bacterium]